MKTIIATFSVMAIAASLSMAQDQSTQSPAGRHRHPRPAEIFKRLDKNADGFLSLDELKSGRRGQKHPAKAEGVFKKMDSNSDGKVTLQEFRAFHRRHDQRGGAEPSAAGQ